MSTIHAIFKDGVFRPREPVELPDGSEVVFEPRIVNGSSGSSEDILSEIYEILGKRFDSGDRFGAERHNEHQP